MSKSQKDRKVYETVKTIEVVSQAESLSLKYLELLRMELRNHYPDGEKSESYFYETVLRKNFDAVAVLLFEQNKKDGVFVYLHRTLRPALAIREYVLQGRKIGALAMAKKPVLLEVIAGILEASDQNEESLRRRAIAEVWEEGGIRLKAQDLHPLGQGILPTPGMNPEIIYLYAGELRSFTSSQPPGDGSPVEEVTGITRLSLAQALKACWQGSIQDAKTQISLYRLQTFLKDR